MKKLITFFWFTITLACCTAVFEQDLKLVSDNKIHISDNIVFDDSLKRYVFEASPLITRSESEIAEALAVERENAILDSLCNVALLRGWKTTIIYAKSNRNRLRQFSDDSTGGITPVEPEDTSAVYTTSGTLRRNQSSEELLNLPYGYQVDIDGFCSLSYSGIIYTLNYKTYHNLSVVTDEGQNFILTGESDPLFPQETFIGLSGASFSSPVNTVYLGYTNSDSLNDKTIEWKCDYCIVALPLDTSSD